MSRAFAKEDDALEAPLVPARAPLPPNTPNYVTPRGLELLRQELQALEAEQTQVATSQQPASDRTRQLLVLSGRLAALRARLASARLVDNRGQKALEVRFGATVRLRTVQGRQPGQERVFTVVGVDEAAIAEGRVAFVAPLARAILGARPGQQVIIPLGPPEVVEVVAVDYLPAT